MTGFRRILSTNWGKVESHNVSIPKLAGALDTPGAGTCFNVEDIGWGGWNGAKAIASQELAARQLQVVEAFVFFFVIRERIYAPFEAMKSKVMKKDNVEPASVLLPLIRY